MCQRYESQAALSCFILIIYILLTAQGQTTAELEPPAVNVISWKTDSQGSVDFYVDNKSEGLPDEAQFKISCFPEDNPDNVLQCSMPTDWLDECTIDGFLRKTYSCSVVLHDGPNRSSKSPAIFVIPCYGWEEVPSAESINVTTELTDIRPRSYKVDLRVMGFINNCDHVDITYLMFETVIFNENKSSSLYAESFYGDKEGLYTLQPNNLEPDTPYQLNMIVYDQSDLDNPRPVSYLLPFKTSAVYVRTINITNVEVLNNPASLEVSFQKPTSSEKDFFAPDIYQVEYRKTAHTNYQNTWTSQDLEESNGMIRGFIAVDPNTDYELRVITSLDMKVSSVTSISDVRDIMTAPCEAPSEFDFVDPKYDFVGTADTVTLKVYYKAPEKSNCDNKIRYRMRYRHEDNTAISEEDCQTHTQCTISGLDAISKYFIDIIASNNGNKTTTSSSPLAVTTGEKTPNGVEDVKLDVSEKPAVLISWKAPSVLRSNDGVKNYTIHVTRISDKTPIVNSTVTKETKYRFTGEYNTGYNVEIRGGNVAGFGVSTKNEIFIPPTIPGEPKAVKIETLNRTCVTTSWSVPDFDGGIISEYLVKCLLIKTYANNSIAGHDMVHQVKMELPKRPLDEKVCRLIAGSHYNCSVSAYNVAGAGKPITNTVWTAPNKPQKPAEPEIIENESTKTTITLRLTDAPSVDRPVSSYFIGVERIPEAPAGRSKRSVVKVDLRSLSSSSFVRYTTDTSTRYITANLTKFSDTFVIGDDKTYNGYVNTPLTNGQQYNIYYGFRVTRGEHSEETFTMLSAPVTVAAYSNPTVIVAAISSVVTILVVLFIVALVIFFLKKRRNGAPTARAELIPLKRRPAMKSPDSESANGAVIAHFNPIKVTHLRSYIATHHSEISQQYAALPKGFLAPCTAALNGDNKAKNRFANILPYDHCRVMLSEIYGEPNSDYINASYLKGYYQPNQYIASSGPKESTTYDFWRMVWEQRATCIVMVTKCVEESKLKCDKYWPDQRESEVHGDITVTNTSFETWADFTMNTFTIKKSGDARGLTCHHFHFLSWPDHGVPKHSTPFLLFRRKVKAFSSGLGCPLVIHCSAGVGRTGTFIAIDYLLEQAKQEGEINVYQLVQSMRNQRVTMVQTEDQYHYIYQAVCEALETDDFYYSAPQLQDNFPTWSEEGVLERQFEVLEETCMEVEAFNFECGGEKENKTKNQNPAILPHDYHRAHIISQPRGYSTYINAIFINSYRKKDLFVVTQQPLPHTVDDYLRLIFDQHISTVVTLESDINTNPRFGIYMPETVNTPVETDLFVISMTEVNDVRADIVVSELTLTYKQAQGEATHSFRHFQARFWDHDSPLPQNKDTFITLLEQVEKWQQTSDCGAICIQCRDGNERCSILLSVWNSLDRLKTEQEVDIYHTVELIRMIRPQAITNSAQYTFIYEMLYEYLQEFDLYANYK